MTFTAMAETINAVDAWLGSLPGHVYANVRQPPISTLNLAHMIPLSAVMGGPGTGRAFRGLPLAFRQDRGCYPVPVVAACGRCRTHACCWPDGCWKIRAAGFDGVAVPALSATTQVFAFDFGGSIRAATLAMGGDWHDLGGTLTEGASRQCRIATTRADSRHTRTRLGG